MREIHRQLTDQDHKITVLAPSYMGLRSHQLDGIEVKRFRYAPAKIERLTHEEGATYKVRKAYMQLLAIPYIIIGCLVAAWMAWRRNFDVIHVHWPFPHGLMGQVARWVTGGRLVIMSHGAEFSLARRKKWVTPLLRQSLRAADLRIANSSNTAEWLTSAAIRRAMCCLTEPPSVPPMSAEPSAVPRVLFTGRLIERKGLEYLLQAVPTFCSNSRAVRDHWRRRSTRET